MRVYINTDVVREKLIRSNLSQGCLAKRLGVCTGYMSQLLDGSRHPSAKVRKRLMSIFSESSFDDLFIIKENE